MSRLQYFRNNHNVTVSASAGLNGLGTFRIRGDRAGWCNVTIFGSKHGRETSFRLVSQVLTEAPKFIIDSVAVYIPSPEQTATVRVDCNYLGNLQAQSTDSNTATSAISGNTLTITARAVGVCEFRVWKQHQEHREKRIKVIVGKPVVLIDNKAAPLWTRGSGASVQHRAVTYQNGATDYDVEILHPENLDYNKDTRTITTKGEIVANEYYLIRLTPKVGDVKQDENTSSYLVIKGQ